MKKSRKAITFQGLKSSAPQFIAYAIICISIYFLFNFTERYFNPISQIVIGWTLLGLIVIFYKIEAFKAPHWRILLLVISAILSIRYFLWRTFETLLYTGPLDFTAMMVLYFAECYTFIIHALGLFINIWPMDRKIIPLPSDPSLLPTVDIFIPTYTESEEIVKITAIAATQIYYPKDKLRIYILDDGGTVARRNNPSISAEAWDRHYKFKRMANEIGVNYITRERNESAKAGNINNALKHTNGELILMLDCDHVPTRDFLQNTVGFFLKDKKLFLVQTPHFFINQTPVEKNVATVSNVPGENDMFYRVIQPGLDSWNGAYFCGSAAVLRRHCIEEIGGVTGETITEDAETSFHLHCNGYNSVYLNHPMVCGLSPETFDDYIAQRTRWAQGMTQLLILNNPLTWIFKGLTLPQTICYFNASFFWFFGISRVIFYLAPAAFLLAGLKIYHASMMQILAYSIPHIIGIYLIMDFLYGKVRRPFFSEIYESVQSLFLLPAVVSVIFNPRKPTFKITPKGKTKDKDSLNPLALIFFAIIAVNMTALFLAVNKWFLFPLYRDVVFITSAWCIFNMLLAITAIGAFWEAKQVRLHHRINTRGKISVLFTRMNQWVDGDITDVSLTGIGVKLKTPFPVKPLDDLVLKSTDSYGETSMLNARIQRHIERGGISYCGTEFIGTNDNLTQIIRFVYGDSRRWKNIYEDSARSQGAARMLWSLSMVGLMAFKESFLLLMQLTGNLFKRYTRSAIESINSIYINRPSKSAVRETL